MIMQSVWWMDLKIGEQLDIQDLTVRIVLNTFFFLIFNLLSRRLFFFWAVFMKYNGNPLGVKHTTHSIFQSCIDQTLYTLFSF